MTRPFRVAPVSALVVAVILWLSGAPATAHAQRAAAGDGGARRVTRAADGRPGPGYWQQAVDYDLDATLDPAAHRVSGRGTIVYHNNSPDALGELHWHLYYNVFGAGAITVTRLETAAGAPLVQEVRGTVMRTPLPALLAPGDSLALRVEWTATVPAMPASALEASGRDLAARRTGFVGEDYAVCQWYPQISVYDDVYGWNDLPYLGQGEFYLEYGDWDVRLTVPRRFTVAATGTLENPDAALPPRAAAAYRSLGAAAPGTLVPVVTPADTGGRGAAGATRTWRFTARRVRDFAWAASPRFLWNATRTAPTAANPAGVRIHSFFAAEQAADYAGSWDVARRTIERFSARVGDYVYPQASAVSGPAVGMEYPMLAFEGEVARLESGYLNMPENVTVHELGHQWFPMMVGSNETRHAFMDEGFNSYLEILWFRENYGRGGFFSPRMPLWLRGLAGRGDHRRLTADLGLATEKAAAGATATLMTPADSIPPALLGALAYQKPAMVLVMLRETVGADVFDRAMREYFARWLYRHPYPDDFFNTVENVAGRDLDWFWRPWFYRRDTLDLSIADVASARRGEGYEATVALRNATALPVAVTLRLGLEGGAIRTARVPATVWLGGERARTVTVPALPAPVRTAELDPDHALYEADHADNLWPAGAAAAEGPPFGVTRASFAALVLLAVLAALAARAAGRGLGLHWAGLAPARLTVGNTVLWTRGGGRPRRVAHPRLFGGGTLGVPPAGVADDDLALRFGRLGAAGPLATLAALLLALLVLRVRERIHDAGGLREGSFHVDSWLALLLAVAGVGLVVALLPRRAGGRYFGPEPWLRLLLSPGSPAMQRWSAVQALRAQSFAGDRPRAWNPAWVREATALSDGSTAEAGACMLAYLWALDRGDTPEATLYLDRAWTAARRRFWRIRIRGHVRGERAFHNAYLEGDVDDGERTVRRWGSLFGAPAHVRRRARVALLLGRAERARAAALTRRGLVADPRTTRWGGAGLATFERYWLAVLLAGADRRVGSAVVTPSVSSVAVLVQQHRDDRTRSGLGRMLRRRG